MPVRSMFWSLALLVLAGCSQPAAGTDSGPASDAGGSTDSGTASAPRLHRAMAVECSHDRAAGNGEAGDPTADCVADADCVDGINGRCLVTTGGARLNYCSYDDCFADSECGAAEVCRCREEANAANDCTAGSCVVDADCGAGGFCSPSAGFDRINYGVVGYFCHTPGDTCVDDEDCRVDGGTAKCTWFPADARWACSDQGFFPP